MLHSPYMTYTPTQFRFGPLTGISEKQLDVHIKLYEGYVKHVNHLYEALADLRKDTEKNAYAIAEVSRRLGFEWNGMRMHEHYFAQWEGEHISLSDELTKAIETEWSGMENWMNEFKAVAMMRGIGWTILSQDVKTGALMNHWVSDHELGQLNDTHVIIALDMWEHAFMVDYTPAEKAQYIDAWFKNLNGEVISRRYVSSLPQ
jgi:superoxide dismutase, Fe-Mn family